LLILPAFYGNKLPKPPTINENFSAKLMKLHEFFVLLPNILQNNDIKQ